MDEKIITITMEGGIIQSVEGVPPGVRVRIIDFDDFNTGDADEGSVTKFDNGDKAVVTEYGSETETPQTE